MGSSTRKDDIAKRFALTRVDAATKVDPLAIVEVLAFAVVDDTMIVASAKAWLSSMIPPPGA